MTETRTMTLAEFLLARIAEDEARAQPFPLTLPGDHDCFDIDHESRRGKYLHSKPPTRDEVLMQTCSRCGRDYKVMVGGYARRDPGSPRILAECEAKRRIVELHGDAYHDCPMPDAQFGGHFDSFAICPTMLALALPYADHPDFRDEWRV